MKRTPVPKESPFNNKPTMLKWKTMREAEKRRLLRNKKYTLYKNTWFLNLVNEATKVVNWTSFEIVRAKKFRLILDQQYHVPINFYSAFVYFSTYQYFHWDKRQRDFSNFVGFLQSEYNVERFARFLSTRSLLWRRKNSRWPEDYHDQWGIKTTVNAQRLGTNDHVVKDSLMSDKLGRQINKYL